MLDGSESMREDEGRLLPNRQADESRETSQRPGCKQAQADREDKKHSLRVVRSFQERNGERGSDNHHGNDEWNIAGDALSVRGLKCFLINVDKVVISPCAPHAALCGLGSHRSRGRPLCHPSCHNLRA